jgi:hypothetical protein
MGGHAAGDVASALTIQAIAESMDPSGPNAFSGAEAAIGDRLVEAFAAAQNRVSDRSLSEPECNGMGSTVIAGLWTGEDLYLPCRRRSGLSLFREPAHTSYERSLVSLEISNFRPVNARSG